jgi:hypothetical protein
MNTNIEKEKALNVKTPKIKLRDLICPQCMVLISLNVSTDSVVGAFIAYITAEFHK